MPPKAAKPKMSKAEKEKLKQEEEERKAEEDEEARRRAEIEEKERKKQEKLMAAERKKQENEEKKQRCVEMKELLGIIDDHKEALDRLHDERRKQAKWLRYMRCDGSPDPTIPGEINTYINLRVEDDDHNDVESVLKASKLDTALINELDFLLEDTPPEELKPADVAMYKETKEELQALIKKKMDAATQRLLQEASDRADPETFNLQFAIKNEDVCLSVWGNLSKNPRVKSFEFTQQGLTFEIPRILTLSDCSYRVLDPRYDHYSPTCKSFYPRQKKKPEPEPIEEELPQETEEEKKDEEKKEEGEEEEQVEREETDLMAALNALEDGPKEENEDEGKEEEKEKEEEIIEEYEIPDEPEPVEYEDFDEDDDVVDLRANDIVGGVFHFDLMCLPPQPKAVQDWTITRKVDPPEIQYMEYVADSVMPPAPTDEGSPTQDKQEVKKDEKPPIGITMKLPSEVLFSEEPLIAKWDYQKKCWRQDGFTDPKYDEAKREFSFKTAYFGTFSLMQDSHLNMPFQSWELRPHKTNSALLTIIAAIVEVEIEIKDSLCCLSKPDDKPELEKIRNKWVTPKELVKLMKLAGINLFPAEDSPKYVSIQNKHPVVAELLYQQMALTSSCYAYSWSKWNSEVQERDKIFFLATECLEDEQPLEEDWSVCMATKTRTMKLALTDFDDDFKEDLAEGTMFKSNLYHLVKSLTSEQGLERIDNTSFQFIDCVHQLLMATKLLTYS